ncbi:hypothetical protein CD790_12525 [Streptomyces sp. SAJ15]|nr:hypothetical protein [Streptomyces sp. SAJ15]TVL92493.1 hypothetical protein CD790_12525 [Streptomyces sp. SAJ15]
MEGIVADAATGTIRTDYGGAVYGSLLAASVVAGTAASGHYSRVELIVLLLATGVVFWAAHVYARLAGERILHQALSWREVRRVGAAERPTVEASVPPAVAVAVSPLLGLGLVGAAYLSLAVAVTQQIGWGVVALRRAGASARMMAVAAAVNLVLGLTIVVLKAVLQH